MKKSIFYVILLALLAPVLTSCDDEQAMPPIVLPEGGLGSGVWNDPMTCTQVNEGQTGTDVWVKGYIVGWIDTDASLNLDESSAKFTTPATITSNLLMAATPEERDLTKLVTVQLPTGDVRSALNLQDHPENLGKMVCIRGNIEKYFKVYGVKSVNAYNWGEEGIEEKPAEMLNFKKVSDVTAGGTYLLVVGNQAAQNITGTYGWLYVEDVTINGDLIEGQNNMCFTFEKADNGYYIKQNDGRYLYMTGTYNSFNLTDSPSADAVFTVTPNADGTVSITNVTMGKTIQYDSSHTSYGAYSDSRGELPTLYELQK